MPELIEVEIYRKTACKAIGRTIAAVECVDPFGLRNGGGRTTPEGLVEALVGATVVGARRLGKLLLLDLGASAGSGVLTERGGGALPGAGVVGSAGVLGALSVLGLRFGMTGRLVVDGMSDIDELLYTSRRDDSAWDRFRVRFEDGGSMAVRDPRRLGAVELDPDVSQLGPDATVLTLADLRAALRASTASVKARIMDQHLVAGIGNLLADEILWRAGIAPATPSSSLGAGRVGRLHAQLVETVADLTLRGGSHLGDVMEARHPGGHCPRDGAPMRVAQVGGRTSWWCPKHQR